jgi:hypothetical protein
MEKKIKEKERLLCRYGLLKFYGKEPLHHGIFIHVSSQLRVTAMTA